MSRLLILVLGTCLQLTASAVWAEEFSITPHKGDPEKGRLVFGPCRTCHYPEAFMGHNNGPNLSGIFGRVAGKQEGFNYYSETFKQAQFIWTEQLMYAWLENPMKMFPDSTMMSLGVPDHQRRADLIAYLLEATQRDR
jgi:cytochrome c